MFGEDAQYENSPKPFRGREETRLQIVNFGDVYFGRTISSFEFFLIKKIAIFFFLILFFFIRCLNWNFSSLTTCRPSPHQKEPISFVQNVAKCSETNEKSIFRFLVIEIWFFAPHWGLHLQVPHCFGLNPLANWLSGITV